jgi:hypothetical protein
MVDITSYIPGQGMPPYSAGSQTVPTTSSFAQQIKDFYRNNPNGDINSFLTSMNSYTNPQPTTDNTAQNIDNSSGNGNNGITAIGQGEAWLSPDELRAKLNSLQTNMFSGQSGSGGGGGAGGFGSGSGSGTGGLNLNGVNGNAQPGATPGQIQNNPINMGGTVGYQNPGSVFSNGTVGYNIPGASTTAGQAGTLQMTPANAQSALDSYKNTAGYQLLNTPGAYQQSPGYQYALQQALQSVNSNAAARGMLESGAALKQAQTTAAGLANQDYNNWWNRQNQLYSDYQNRLQGLAGGPTGSADAMTAGANLAQANLQTGSNLGSLFGGQGTSGMGGIINTAAAQAGNIINAGQQQAQIEAANQATQLAGATLGAQQQQQGYLGPPTSAKGLF